jgi:hypothetical protein
MADDNAVILSFSLVTSMPTDAAASSSWLAASSAASARSTPPHEESEQPEREHDVVGEHAIGLNCIAYKKAIAVRRLCPERAAV